MPRNLRAVMIIGVLPVWVILWASACAYILGSLGANNWVGIVIGVAIGGYTFTKAMAWIDGKLRR